MLSTRERRRQPLSRRFLWVLLAATLTAGCRMTVEVDLTVEPDASGRLELALTVDRELGDLLERAGVDVATRVRGALDGAWSLEEAAPADGGGRLVLAADFADAGELGRLVADLNAGLDARDPRILQDVQLRTLEDGDLELTAMAGLRPPDVPGVEGDGVPLTPEDLAQTLATMGDRAVAYTLTATLPGEIVETDDGATVDGERVVWRPGVGELRTIRAVADPPEPPYLLLAAAATAVAAVAAATVVARRRRRRASRASRMT